MTYENIVELIGEESEMLLSHTAQLLQKISCTCLLRGLSMKFLLVPIGIFKHLEACSRYLMQAGFQARGIYPSCLLTRA